MSLSRALAVVLLCSCGTLPAAAREVASGALPIAVSSSAAAGLSLGGEDELRIEGVVEAAANVIVVLRADDAQSGGYASRFNGERTLPPGKFSWTVPAKALRAPNGRVLEHEHLARMMLFVGHGEGKVVVTRFAIERAPRLPEGAKGYALGPETAELPAGFERIGPNDPRVAGRKIFAIRRPAPDPLVASGLRGLERLTLPWSGGRARVTLWTEDPGEWELLPHPLARRIRVNGTDALSERMSVEDWLARRYLRGADAEHGPADDAWTAYGSRRGGRLRIDVDPTPEGIVIELAGDGAEALYLSAVLIEPAGSDTAGRHVEDLRAQWYRTNWPVVPAGPGDRTPAAAISVDTGEPLAPLKTSAARGTGTHLTLSLTSRLTVAQPHVRLEPAVQGATQLTGLVWAARSRLERRHANATVLTLADDMLSDAASSPPLIAGQPRTYEIWLDVPASAPAGVYRGALVIEAGAETRIPIEIEVLPVDLPAAKPAGFYLDEPPHLDWLPEGREARGRQIACDLSLMARLGLDGAAPALATPPRDGQGEFDADMRRAAAAGIAAPWLAYAPAKRLLAGHGLEGSAEIIARVEERLRQAGLVPPLWSLADEPSNPDQPAGRLEAWISAIRAKAPNARLAAQLNAPGDRRLVKGFDTVIVNEGYGIDVARLEDAATLSHDVWLYNTDRPRLTAGLWLWRTPASRYVQWHARMPTADPFDPIDGREGDVQTIYPAAEVCPSVPAVDRALLAMADGVVDQRWLAWLSAETSPQAAALRAEISAQAGTQWKGAARLGDGDLARNRQAIIALYLETRRDSK